jgi:hypothetical protein
MAGVLFVFMHTVYSHLDTRGGDSAGFQPGKRSLFRSTGPATLSGA